MNTGICYLLLIFMTILGAAGSMFLKLANDGSSILGLIKKPKLYIGGILYFLSALINILVLRYMDYSVVLPLTSVTYIWTMVLSYFCLGERITGRKMVGVAVIVVGAVCIALG